MFDWVQKFVLPNNLQLIILWHLFSLLIIYFAANSNSSISLKYSYIPNMWQSETPRILGQKLASHFLEIFSFF